MTKELPPRTSATMADAIAASSPSGRMSKRARDRANKALSLALFGPGGMPYPEPPPQPSAKQRLLEQAKRLREFAARGMSVQKFTKEADRLEKEAAELTD